MSEANPEEQQERPLQALFTRAQALFAQASAAGAATPTGREPAQQAAQLLDQCSNAVERLALFSGNEDQEDLATPDLKYLSIPYIRAELRGQAGAVDMRERHTALQDSKHLYMRFLHRLQQYGLLDLQTLAAFERVESGDRTDPTTTRASKITLFKREKEVEQQLEAMTRKRIATQRRGAADLDLEDDGIGGAGLAVDEEAERDAWLLQLDLYALKAVGQLASVQQELEMLQHVSAMPEEERRAAAVSNAPPPEMLDQLRGAAAGLESLRASGLDSQREDIRRNLLRPSHNLPTRTLAQQADIEMAQAREAAARQQEAEQRRAAKGSDDEDDDEAVHRQRAMDDWKDTHPAGYGNSKLRPTA